MPQRRRQPVRSCIGTLTLRRKHWIELDGRFVIGEARGTVITDAARDIVLTLLPDARRIRDSGSNGDLSRNLPRGHNR